VECIPFIFKVKQASENSIVQRMQGRRQSTRDAVECILFIFKVKQASEKEIVQCPREETAKVLVADKVPVRRRVHGIERSLYSLQSTQN
jgi:hypothetical protein